MRRRGRIGALALGAAAAAASLMGGCALSTPQTDRPMTTLEFGTEHGTPVPDADLQRIERIVAQRLTNLGIAKGKVTGEPDRTGILVRFEGQEDQVDEAQRLVETIGRVRFRPVLATHPDDPTTAVTAEADDTPDATVTLSRPGSADGKVDAETFQLGPASSEGDLVSSAGINNVDGVWRVTLALRVDALQALNEKIIAACFAEGPTCPTGELAVVVDHQVLAVQSIEQRSFSTDAIQVPTHLDEQANRELAAILQSGPLPVRLVPQS